MNAPAAPRSQSQAGAAHASDAHSSGRLPAASSPSLCNAPSDPTIEFIYSPYTITLFAIFLVGAAYTALFELKDDHLVNLKLNAIFNALFVVVCTHGLCLPYASTTSDALCILETGDFIIMYWWILLYVLWIGIAAAIIVVLITGLLQFRDGPFIRPHPAFWRIVLAAGVAYQIFLVVILFQTKERAREILNYLDPTLGLPLPERSYAEDCTITWDVVWSQIDVFVFAHTFGWFAKALILRNHWFCWILSILFEMMEYSLEHQLPNFAECWWDHWVMDVLVTNWLGIYFGMKACDYFKLKKYYWSGFEETPTIAKKSNKTKESSKPQSWIKFDWVTSKTPRHFIAAILLIYLELQCELNAFYLKYLLRVPIEHPANLCRLLFFFFMCLPAVREAYHCITDPNCNRLGMHGWITTTNIITELLIIIKFSRGEFTKPMPQSVVWFWCVFAVVLVAYGFGVFGFPLTRSHMANRSDDDDKRKKE